MLIAIEGVTGVGKSTLQGILSSFYRAENLIIDFKRHPYFEVPDLEISEYVLEREMIFMLMGYHHLKNVNTTNKLVISDFIFDRFRVFAEAALSRTDLETIFYPCFHYLNKHLPKFDLIVRLVGSPDLILSRIHTRNRGGEDYITEEYIRRIDQAWNTLFEGYQMSKVLTINSNKYDFVKDKKAFQHLTLMIESELSGLQDYRIG